DAKDWAQKIAAQFGKLEGLDIAQLAHIAPEEEQATYELAEVLVSENRAPNDDELKLLRHRPKAVDIALFGRMLASSTQHNVEAAAQVAHAISVNAVKIEDDFFTAVDDLNKHEEDAGAGHMGDASFGSGIFYQYICINKTALVENLQNDEALANKAIKALTETAAKVAPTGKQNSFASRAYTSCLLAEKGSQQPRALSVAFLKAVRSGDPMNEAISALTGQRDNFEKVYGKCADESKLMNAQDPDQSASFEDVLNFVVT
ncbi:MAG: type I-E CRISPR-associated protein Cas7/Cse4/CasC, partial [Thiolinea sp.]